MTVASKQKKLEKRVESSKSLSHFDKMRFNMAIKKALNIKTLKDVEEEIGETIQKKLSEKRSEDMTIQWTMRDPALEGGGAFTERKIEHYKDLQGFTEIDDVPSKAASETEVVGYRKKFKDFINKSTLLDAEEKKKFDAMAGVKDPNWNKIKNELKATTKKNADFRSKKREAIENIKSNEHIPEDQKKKFIKSITETEDPKKLSKIKVKVDIVSEREERKTREALEKMLRDIEKEKAFVEIPEVKEPIKKELAKEIEEAKKKKPEIVATRKPVTVKKPTPVMPVPTPTGLVAPSLVDPIKFKGTLRKTIEGSNIPQDLKNRFLKDLDTGAVEPRVLSGHLSIAIEKERKAGRVVAKPLPKSSVVRLPPDEKGYIDIKKTDIVPERYTEILFKKPGKSTQLDRKRWSQFKQVNMELAEKIKPRKIEAEHYGKLVKLKGGNLDLADKAYERYLRSLNLSDSVIAYERRKEREVHERDIKVKGERIVKRLPSGKFVTETGKEIEIDRDVVAGRSKDPIVIYLGPDKGRTKGGKIVSLRKAPLRDEAIYLMDIARGMARTDTGRSIRIEPKIWNKFKAVGDPIVKYEVATKMLITKSGRKTFPTTKLEDAVISRPDYISPAKKMEAKRRETRERAYLLAKGIFVRDRKGKDPDYIGLSESLPGERGVLADNIPRDKVDDWINLNVGPDRYHMYQWREFKVLPKSVAETLLRRSKKEKWREQMEPKRVLTAIEQDAKTKMEIQRKKAEAVKPLTEKQIREQTGKMVRVPVMKKDEAGIMRMVKEKVVVGDPKLRQIGVVRRAEVKPLTEQEIARIMETGVRQRQILMEEAQLYQDKLKAQKFLASAFKGKIKPFPKKGYSTYKIVAAYRKRKPMWRLQIRRDYNRDEVHMKFVCTNDYLRGRDEVTREVQKVLVLMNMRMTPDATIRDVKPPRVGPKYRWIHVAVKAKKIGEGEIRSR